MADAMVAGAKRIAKPAAVGALLGHTWHVACHEFQRGSLAGVTLCLLGILVGLISSMVLLSRVALGLRSKARLSLFWVACLLGGGLITISYLRLLSGSQPAYDVVALHALTSTGLLGASLPYIVSLLKESLDAELVLPSTLALLVTESLCSNQRLLGLRLFVSFFLLVTGLLGLASLTAADGDAIQIGGPRPRASRSRGSTAAVEGASSMGGGTASASFEVFAPTTSIATQRYSPHFLVQRRMGSLASGSLECVPLLEIAPRSERAESSRAGRSVKERTARKEAVGTSAPSATSSREDASQTTIEAKNQTRRRDDQPNDKRRHDSGRDMARWQVSTEDAPEEAQVLGEVEMEEEEEEDSPAPIQLEQGVEHLWNAPGDIKEVGASCLASVADAGCESGESTDAPVPAPCVDTASATLRLVQPVEALELHGSPPVSFITLSRPPTVDDAAYLRLWPASELGRPLRAASGSPPSQAAKLAPVSEQDSGEALVPEGEESEVVPQPRSNLSADAEAFVPTVKDFMPGQVAFGIDLTDDISAWHGADRILWTQDATEDGLGGWAAASEDAAAWSGCSADWGCGDWSCEGVEGDVACVAPYTDAHSIQYDTPFVEYMQLVQGDETGDAPNARPVRSHRDSVSSGVELISEPSHASIVDPEMPDPGVGRASVARRREIIGASAQVNDPTECMWKASGKGSSKSSKGGSKGKRDAKWLESSGAIRYQGWESGSDSSSWDKRDWQWSGDDWNIGSGEDEADSGAQVKNCTWAYVDPHDVVRTGFSTEDMREWFEAGYFGLDMLVTLKFDDSLPTRGDFYPLWRWFRAKDKAFTYVPKF